VGTAADYMVRGVTGLHAKTVREWVAAIKRLAGDAALRERLGRAGRMRICGEYDFSALIPKVTNLLGEVLA
jgi:glycosyltransferase involved in cell wall biosynthesis